MIALNHQRVVDPNSIEYQYGTQQRERKQDFV